MPTYSAYSNVAHATAQIPIVLATVTTTAINIYGNTTATGGGNVTNVGYGTISARGVCYGLSANPDITGGHTSNGTGSGVFSSPITGLSVSTLYHIRSYATNEAGTAYGSDIIITTLNAYYHDSFTDVNNTKLNTHTMDLGAGWTCSDAWLIDANGKITFIASTWNCAIIDVSNNAVKISCQSIMPNLASYAGGFTLRYSDSTHFWECLLARDSGGIPYMLLREFNGGAGVIKQQVSITQENNLTSTFRVTVSGNVFNGYWKDMVTPVIGNYSNAELNTNTKHGLRGFATSGYATPVMDDIICESP